jgi:predicted dehydrogenase
MEDGEKLFHLVIEGAGAVVGGYYLPALERLGKEGFRFAVTFVDDSRYWRADSRLAAAAKVLLAKIAAMGAQYVDKYDSAGLQQWKALRPDAVVIATPDRTHTDLALEWVARYPAPGTIYIEKPLDVSVQRARDLLGRIGPENPAVRAFDHYRARLLPARAQFDLLEGFLKAGIARFTFYFLEDRSGADPAYAHVRGGRQGPIENENRVSALNKGLLLDIMPHVIAVLAHFGQVNSMELTRLRAGKYTGVDDDPGRPSSIEGETFAEVRFLFRSHQGDKAEGVAYVGKGVKGVGALGSDYDHNVKLLVLEDVNRRKASFDFRKSGPGDPSTSTWIDESGHKQYGFELHADPYYVFLRSVVSRQHMDDRIALPVEVGKKTLEAIEDMRYPVTEWLRRNGMLPEYPSGIYGMRESPYLEDLLDKDKLPFLYGGDTLPRRI